MAVKLVKRCEMCGEKKPEPVKAQFDEAGEQKMLAHDSCVES